LYEWYRILPAFLYSLKTLHPREQIEDYPEPEYMNDLRTLWRLAQRGTFHYRQFFGRGLPKPKDSLPTGPYSALGEEGRGEMVGKYKNSPYMELLRRV
jgi:hypothetical protein